MKNQNKDKEIVQLAYNMTMQIQTIENKLNKINEQFKTLRETAKTLRDDKKELEDKRHNMFLSLNEDL